MLKQQNISLESASDMFSTSAKKSNKAVDYICSPNENECTSNNLNFFIFLYLGIMKDLFEEFSRCSDCSSLVIAVMAFREIGKGYADIQTFITMMNMPLSIAFTLYKKISKNLHYAYEKSTEKVPNKLLMKFINCLILMQ